MNILLDTCALFWWTSMPEKLSPVALEACERMELDGGLVSSISFWELGIKALKEKISLGVDFETFCNRVRSTGVLEIVPVDLDIWISNLALDWDIRDLADRTIVATAMKNNAAIVTSDERISSFYKNIIW